MIPVTRPSWLSMTSSRRRVSSVSASGGSCLLSSSRWPATECSGVPTSCATSAMMRPETARRSAWLRRRPSSKSCSFSRCTS